MGKFGLTEKYATPAPATGGSKFGLTEKYAAPTGDVSSFQTQAQNAAYQSAQDKLRNGGVLNAEEAAATARVKADQQTMSAIAAALQPMLIFSDVTKGIANSIKTGDMTQGNRGMAAAVSHGTYGLAELLPGLAGARANGVTGADLLKNTKYAGNGTGALLMELLFDPSLVLGGAGLVMKGAGMAAKYGALAKFATTANGANTLRDIAKIANSAGTKLLRASDVATGVPAVIKAAGVPLPKIGGLIGKVDAKIGADVAAKGVAGGIAGHFSRLADKTLPVTGGSLGLINQQKLGVRTFADALYTPDAKKAFFTPEQLAVDTTRNDIRLGVADLKTAVVRSGVEDSKAVVALTKGLKPDVAKEVNRLYGVLGNTTDPVIAAEVFRKLKGYSATAGKDLAPLMLDAYKATDRMSQLNLGTNLAARNLPAVLNPAVTKAVQAAQSLDDLLPHIGAYKTADGRPRGILMTQYVGRENLDATIAKVADGPQSVASSTIDAPQVATTLDNAAAALPEIPPAPIAPVGVRPAPTAPPSNMAETLDRILSEPGAAKPASVSDAAAAVPDPALSGGITARVDAPATIPPGGFQTAKGSMYEFSAADNVARRYKVLHPGHDPLDVGWKDPMNARFIADPKQAEALAAAASVQGDVRFGVHGDTAYVLTKNGADRWGVQARATLTNTPGVGATPFEFSDLRSRPTNMLLRDGSAPSFDMPSPKVIHVGNPITELGGVTPVPKTPDVVPPATVRGPAEVLDELSGGLRQSAPPLKPFEPETFNSPMTTYRGEVSTGEHAGLAPNMATADNLGAQRPDQLIQSERAFLSQYDELAAKARARLDDAEARMSGPDRNWRDRANADQARSDMQALADRKQMAEAAQTADAAKITSDERFLNIVAQNKDMLYVSPRYKTAESYAQRVDPETGAVLQQGQVREISIAPSKIADVRHFAPDGRIRTQEQIQKILDELNVPADVRPRILQNLRADKLGTAEESLVEVYPLFRGENASLIRSGLNAKGIDAVRYGEGVQDNIVLLDRSRSAEVMPDGTLKPTSPDVVPYNTGASLGDVGFPKTPAEVFDAVMNPVRPQTGYAAPADLGRTSQADLKAAANVTDAPERLVNKTVPITYRTVSVDPSALDWASLPDLSARRAVANVLGGELERTAAGGFKYSKALAEVPLSHPVISNYFDDATLEAARFPGSGYGERVVNTKSQVPDWYDPKGAPLDVQRGERAATINGAGLNDMTQMERTAYELNTGAMDEYIIGDAYIDRKRPGNGKPLAPADMPRAVNDYAQRVIALNGRAATPRELFQYRMQLARYNQQARLRTVSGDDITNHLTDYFAHYPEGTLFDAVNSAAKQFGLGRGGAKHMQAVLKSEEAGFMRQLSSRELGEFGQYLKAEQRSSIPGGTLTSRMLRNPEKVSAEFEQLFAQSEDGAKLYSQQLERGAANIAKAEEMKLIQEALQSSGQHITARQIIALRAKPGHLLTEHEDFLRTELAYATEQPGRTAGWKIMDKEYGPFKMGDAVPWWAYADIFHASSVEDAAVAAAMLKRGRMGFGEIHDRFFTAMSATRLSSPTSIITDQVGQVMQALMYGLTPDELIEGLIMRRMATPAQLDAMRESGGIASAKLESNLGVDGAELMALSRRLEGDTDLTRVQRVYDAALRFHSYGSGVDRAALTNPIARGVSDVSHAGSAYLFKARSHLSDVQRESLYFHYLKTGLSPKAAGAAANEVLLDMRLAPAYARVVGKYWPFFRWIAMSGPRSIVNILRKPSATYAWNRSTSLSDTATEDGRNDARRILSRPAGLLLGTAGNEWINLGVNERDGTRVYLNGTNWSPNNTNPQLIDFTGTKLGVFTLPDFITITAGVVLGIDRNGLPVYRDSLDGKPGGYMDAARNDPRVAAREAAMYLLQQYQPSYVPGSPRARAWADSVVEAAKLPADGSKDITIAQTIMAMPGGRSMLNYLQHGPAALMMTLDGNRGSVYSSPPSSLAVSSMKFFLPLQTVQVSQREQGTAAAALSIGQLNLTDWNSGERRRLQKMQAGGASREEMRAAQQAWMREGQRRLQRLNVTNLVTK